jgi:hypothetical protein
MVSLRPHVLKWTETAEATIDEATGYQVPGVEVHYEIPCRWHQDSTKVYNNEDSTDVRQKGRIRVDIGSPMPKIGQMLEVVGHFSGPAMEVYTGGTLTGWRIDV